MNEFYRVRDNSHRKMGLIPKLDSITESQIEYLCRTYLFDRASALIENWESKGYNMEALKQIYATYELEYKHKQKRF
jgi:hypothetical protein